MICFGIPSPFVWYKYLECFHYRDKIQGIEFKNKDNGWKKWQVKIKEDSKEKCFGNNGNLYMNSYLQRYNIRESCFFCKIKGMARCSDFTIGDAWGIAEKNKRLNDDKGLSSIVVHSDKAQQLFEKIIDKLTYKQYNAYELMAGNWATNNCPTPNEHYREFWNDYQKLEIDELFEKYLGRMNLYE
jgi:coenzyme F420-reducing hydrogenase beta subunit